MYQKSISDCSIRISDCSIGEFPLSYTYYSYVALVQIDLQYILMWHIACYSKIIVPFSEKYLLSHTQQG